MDTQAIIDAVIQQIQNPRRAVVNSESAFVYQRLADQGLTNEANLYWSWVCGGYSEYYINSPELRELQSQLDFIDSKQQMPSWGTYGT